MAVSGREGAFAEARWLEPALATALLVVCLLINSGDPWPYIWITDLVCCVGAALSYVRPVAGALLVGGGVAVWLMIPGVLPSVSGLAMLIVVMAACRRDLPWKWPLALGAVVLGYLVLVDRSMEDTAQRWGPSAVLLLLLGLAMGSGELWRRWQHLLQVERQSAADELDSFRVALARDLHDTVAQTLSAAAMRAHVALADPSLPAEARADLGWIADQCRSSAHDLRELMGRLRGGDTPSDQPLASIETLVDTVHQQTERLREAGFEASCLMRVQRLSAARSRALSAVTIEAVNNMLKHARPGTPCTIDMRDEAADVVATFTNEMRDAPDRGSDRPGMGLTGVRERLALLGGESSHRSDGRQWRLVARLPHGVDAGD